MKKNAQRGISLIEAIGSLAIGSMMLISMMAMIDSSLDEIKGQRIALHQAQVVNAARKYISANYTDLVAGTVGTVGTITVAQLKTGGFLPDGFSSTNVYNQTPCVLVRQPTSGKLDALVATYGGQAIPERDIPWVAMQAGQGGGYISSTTPGTARGASWTLVTTDYRNVACDGATVLTGAAGNDGGHLVSSLFYDGPGQLSTDFLYRDAVPGRPELNQMNTPVAMAGNALVTPGAACGTKAAFGMDDATRSLLTCGKDGFWKAVSTWREPVLNHGDLPATGNSVGDVRMVTTLGRAFSYDGSGWVALAVDQDGNLQVPGTLSADSVAATTQITTDGTITATGNITSANTVIGKGVQGDWVTGKYWVEGQSLYVNQAASAGDPCNIPYVNPDGSTGITWAIGTIKRDVNGILLTCAWDSVFRYQNGSVTPPY